MCKYVIVKTVIARQDVDGYFGTTLNLSAGLLTRIMSANMSANIQTNQLTGYCQLLVGNLTSDKNFVGV